MSSATAHVIEFGSVAPIRKSVPAVTPAPLEDALPDPEPLLSNLSRCVIEVIAGARDLDPLGRWLAEDVYRHLLTRAQHAARARQVRRAPVRRPSVRVRNVHVQRPCDTAVEGVCLVETGPRIRAVAIRLESTGTRWRATSISVL